MKNIALIPARSGSKRVKNKNIKKLDNIPLINYTIQSAFSSSFFDRIIVVTDSIEYEKIAIDAGAESLGLRPKDISGSNSPDIEWVKWIFKKLDDQNYDFDTFSILRPTSPFRTKNTFNRAFELFFKNKVHSLRAVEKVSQHPGKMWVIEGDKMSPLLQHEINGIPWHSNQKASLPEFYVQNASFEIAWKSTVLKYNSISGTIISPFITEDFEGFDINTNADFDLAKKIVKK
jgi:CMP-N,N'-diacetyllegionaminic acid synthase